MIKEINNFLNPKHLTTDELTKIQINLQNDGFNVTDIKTNLCNKTYTFTISYKTNVCEAFTILFSKNNVEDTYILAKQYCDTMYKRRNEHKEQKTIYAWKFPKNADKVFIGYGEENFINPGLFIYKDGVSKPNPSTTKIKQLIPTNPLYLLDRNINGEYELITKLGIETGFLIKEYGMPTAKPVTMRSIRQDFLKQIKINETNDFDVITKERT